MLQLIGRMKADVALYIHGYNTCAVECAHGERTVLTSKRIEYWTNWEGKCRLVQLLHNHRTRATGESLLLNLGWQVMDGVSTQLGKIDRDKAKHHHIKTSPAYNGRKKAIRVEKKTRVATDPELIARAAAQKCKVREKQRHYYSAKKQLLYEEKERKGQGGEETGEGDGSAAAIVVKKTRGRQSNTVQLVDWDKENDGAGASAGTSKRKKVECATTNTAAERPVLQSLSQYIEWYYNDCVSEFLFMLVSGAKCNGRESGTPN